MVTRKVDRADHLAGFIYNWVKHFAAQVEQLYVISWQEGDSSGLPDNVTVIHLPTLQNKLLKLLRLKSIAWKYLGKVDGVFCHQMPIYTIIVGPLARARRKKVISWYTHRQVDLKMRLMEKIAHVVVTASKESFRLPSKKLVVTGHGIDTELFSYADRSLSEVAEIISIGRISPTKNYETMIETAKVLAEKGVDFRFSIYGDAGTFQQKEYMKKIIAMVFKYRLDQYVQLCGPVPNIQIPQLLQRADIFLNMSDTGSLDKAVLEAMACGCIPITSNVAFEKMLPDTFVATADAQQLADKIIEVIQYSAKQKKELRLRNRVEVEKKHGLTKLITQFIRLYD